jgi:hypothetical protein
MAYVLRPRPPELYYKTSIVWYTEEVKSAVQARLNAEDRQLLDELVRDLDWTPSQIVREGLRLVREAHPTISAADRIIGIGKFSSGIPDLATNKKYLEDFGR